MTLVDVAQRRLTAHDFFRKPLALDVQEFLAATERADEEVGIGKHLTKLSAYGGISDHLFHIVADAAQQQYFDTIKRHQRSQHDTDHEKQNQETDQDKFCEDALMKLYHNTLLIPENSATSCVYCVTPELYEGITPSGKDFYAPDS